eukprot:PITA_28836
MQMSDKSGWKRETSSCSGCKNQRKKCTEKCVLAPYFPQNDPQKFLFVHKVFGKGRVAKLLQDIPAEQRGDAVSSMVYEARARARDPVHGCVGLIKDLQNELAELQLQLESTKVELANIRLQCANLSTLITGYEEVLHPNFYTAAVQEFEDTIMNPIVLDDADSLQLWEPLCSYSSK